MQHVLACLSSAPSNARIIAAAARMAQGFGARFTALYIETPDFAVASAADKQRLNENTRLAEQLGAQVETIAGEDIPFQIAEYARLSGVTTIVLGQSAASRRRILPRPSLTDQLIAYAPSVDIHIIPDGQFSARYRPKRAEDRDAAGIVTDVLRSIGSLLAATVLGVLFDNMGFTDTNIIMVYILAVMLISVITSRLVFSLIASVVSVFAFNYLFTEPRFSFAAYGTGYPVTFITMFLTAMITGTFAGRYKQQAGQAARNAHRTRILFDTDKLLSVAQGREEILRALAGQIGKLLNRTIVIYPAENGVLAEPLTYGHGAQIPCDGQMEREAAQWAYTHNHRAGATTEIMPEAAYMYLALRVGERVYGAVGIEAKDSPLDASENGILLSILGEGALALENEKNAREKEMAAVLAKNEQLRANLLRTISHDLRTPLTTIAGNASSLMSSGESFDQETRRRLSEDIYNDAMWLYNLVENLLYSTRFENGRIDLRQSTELLSDIVEEALRHIRPGARTIAYSAGDEYLLVHADARLLTQVVVNIVDNAVKYTPEGAVIEVVMRREDTMAVVEIADDGPGIAPEETERIFDKFYSGANKSRIADNRRSLGLGLYLCRAIVQAHGGWIRAGRRKPHGAVFTFAIPLKEVTFDEDLSGSGG